jgi:hypothetical protein
MMIMHTLATMIQMYMVNMILENKISEFATLNLNVMALLGNVS